MAKVDSIITASRIIEVMIMITENPMSREEISNQTGMDIRTTDRDIEAIRKIGVKVQVIYRGKLYLYCIPKEWWKSQYCKEPD